MDNIIQKVTPLIVALVLLCLIAYRLWGRRQAARALEPSEATPDSGPPLPAPRSPLLQIPFSSVIDSAGVTEELSRFSSKRFAYDLGLDPANIVVQSISMAQSRDSITLAYRFSKPGLRLLRSGKAVIPLNKANGHLLPMLSERETGKFLELAKARRIHPSQFAKFSGLVVSAAHIISGMDTLRRLDSLDRKLDLILEGRKSDQRAEIEKIYQMARERLSGRLDESDRQEMRTWRGELYKLRSVWRQELISLVSSAPDPNEWRILKAGTWRSKWRERNTRSHLIEGAERMRLVKLSLFVDLCLAYETESLETFVGVTAVDEAALWASLADQRADDQDEN